MNQSSADHAVGAIAMPGAIAADERQGSEYLLFTCRGMACAVPLQELHEVLRAVPASARIPFSPAWLLGIFALRTELLGLVDPAPMLLGAAWSERNPAASPPAATLIVGFGEPLMGLAVGSIGEIVLLRPEQIESGDLSEDSAVAPTYISGRYQPPGASIIYAVLDVAPFVAALLRALREGVDHV